jgi:miniconductance mechanosensitive channel
LDTFNAWLRDPTLYRVFAIVVLVLVAYAAGLLSRTVLMRAVRTLTRHTSWRWDDEFYEHKVFGWLARMVPALVLQFGVEFVPDLSPLWVQVVRKVATSVIVICVLMALARAVAAMESMYRASPSSHGRSLKGAVQLAQLVLVLVGTMVVVVLLTGKSIGLFLSGVGAMSAVLLLVFKDTILGFVAGIQLTSNDMLRIGDWITMDGAGVDGDVIDITLHTVKVRNFDKTIVTVPTWRLIAESFQNWRGMADAGGRRIKRELWIDAAGVRFLSQDEAAALSRFRLMGDYLVQKAADIERWNEALGDPGKQLVNQRRQTNIGAFRAYAQAYLAAHPDVHDTMTRMVRMRDPNEHGVPLEIYCFTRTVVWADYERIQADIFDHLMAILPEFDLAVYQSPSGADFRGLHLGATH